MNDENVCQNSIHAPNQKQTDVDLFHSRVSINEVNKKKSLNVCADKRISTIVINTGIIFIICSARKACPNESETFSFSHGLQHT